MLNRLRNNPFITSILAFLIYAAWFMISGLLPSASTDNAPVTPQPNEVEHMIAQIPNQIGLIILLTGIVALLIWWKPVGFSRHEKGSLKFILPPLLYSTILILFALTQRGDATGFLGTKGIQQLLLVILAVLMVGYTEELMFRGILFYGSVARFRELWGAIISAAIFGAFHFINLMAGQGMAYTTAQVVHAGFDGFMYATLRLITGSLWPVMLLHGLWDLGVAGGQAALQTSSSGGAQSIAQVQAGGISVSPMQILPGLLYGIFVFWRWKKRQNWEVQ